METHIAKLAKQGKSVTKTTAYINSSDIMYKGVFLGYEWNDISNWTTTNELYGQDGEGAYVIYKGEEYTPEMTEIINAILDETGASEMKVIDD